MAIAPIILKMGVMVTLMLVGFLCTRVHITGPEFNRWANPVVINVFLLATILNAVIGTQERVSGAVLAEYFGLHVLMFVLSMLVAEAAVRVIRVPQTRFYTKITQYDGKTSGQEAGGYIGTTSTGYNINFLIVHPSAVLKVMKHVLPRIFAPDVNQSADAWKFDYRVYYDVFAYANKVNGIYLHRAATAISA